MAGVWLDDGIQAALDAITNHAAFPAMYLRLYSNNLTPTDANVLGDFTEATFASYAAVLLTGWSAAAVLAHQASSSPTPAVFTISSGSQNIYGWYATNLAGTKAYWAQRASGAPIAMDAAGITSLTVTPSLTPVQSV